MEHHHNGILKYWPIVLFVVAVVSGYAVLCKTVTSNSLEIKENVALDILQDERIQKRELMDAKRDEQFANLSEKLDDLKFEQRRAAEQQKRNYEEILRKLEGR